MENTALQSAAQSLQPGHRVELFSLDLNPIGVNDVWYFTQSTKAGTRVSYQGIEYVPLDVQVSGFEYNGVGAFPQPKLVANNALRFFAPLVLSHQDGVGAKLTRLRTYKQFLDGETSADPEAYFEPDIYYIEQKTRHTKRQIEWRLAAAADQANMVIPQRKMFRDTCTHAYRVAKPDGTFDYANATCPYTEARYFTRDGVTTADPTQDKCGLRLTDCKKRFAAGTTSGPILPTRAFPGLTRVPVA